MAISDLYLFLKDRLHVSNPLALSPAPVLTASSTANGYAIENVREADLTNAWKPNDSTTTDEWLKVDGGATDWTGASSITYAVLAWDSRGADQDTVKLQTDSVDDGAFGGTLSTKATWDVSPPYDSEVTMKVVGFARVAKRWWRLIQFGNERTEATGTVTAKILCWGMFDIGDIFRLSIDHPGLGEGVFRVSQSYGVNVSHAAGGQPFTNKYAAHTQRFTVIWKPGTTALYESVRDKLMTLDGFGRAIFVTHEGLHNLAEANFGLCRLTGNWDAVMTYDGQYEFQIELETQPWL